MRAGHSVAVMGESCTIGVVMDFFRPAVIDGAGAYARENRLCLDARWAVRADWMPNHPRWDGVLAHFTDMEATYQRVASLGLPVVHLSGFLGGEAIPRVQHDFAACAALAVEEFSKLGLKRVVGLDLRKHSIDRRSYRGLRVALRHAGMAYERLEKPASGSRLMDCLGELCDSLERVERPFGLFLAHAGFAWSLVEELVTRGVSVPDETAIIVIDKDAQKTCALAPVSLTSITLDDWQQGYESARLLHAMIRGEPNIEGGVKRIKPAGIVRRESTGENVNWDPVVAKALHLIEACSTGGLGADELATRVGVSRRNFEQRFRAATGTTPHAAILDNRITEAKRLLKAGRSSVANVAEACGFSSVHYFTTAFKRECGMTPGTFRKNSVGGKTKSRA